ncbi:MAG: RNA 2',3'-cyclic phosphodiesterase [Pseudomonadota bacterium]
MIRSFIGLAPPPSISAAALSAQAGLALGRLVEAEDLHLTLAFLGNQPWDALEDLHLALQDIAAPAVPVALDGLGVFGEGQAPRSLHALVVADPALALLRRQVSSAVRASGIELARRRFVPHITLARFSRRGWQGEDLARLQGYIARQITLKAGPEPATALRLYRSHLGTSGASYEVLAEYRLG